MVDLLPRKVRDYDSIGILSYIKEQNVCRSRIVMMTSSNGHIFRVTGPLSPVNSPHKGQWRWGLMFSLWACKNGWINTRNPIVLIMTSPQWWVPNIFLWNVSENVSRSNFLLFHHNSTLIARLCHGPAMRSVITDAGIKGRDKEGVWTTRRRLNSSPHYPVHPPTPPLSHNGHGHGHERSIHIPFVPC